MVGVKLYKKLVADFPKRFEAPFQLGTKAVESGQYDKAGGWFKIAYHASTKDDSKLLCLLNWSDVLFIRGKADSAEVLLNEGLKYTRNAQVIEGIHKRINELKNIKH
jgi:hypothetical protein